MLTQDGDVYAKAWNFGPDNDSDATVAEVAALTAKHWGRGAEVTVLEKSRHENKVETGLLRLDSNLARLELGWHPRWPLDTAVKSTVDWYKSWLAGSDMQSIMKAQIDAFLHNQPTGSPGKEQ